MKGKKCRSIFLKIKKVAKGPPPWKKGGGESSLSFWRQNQALRAKKKRKLQSLILNDRWPHHKQPILFHQNGILLWKFKVIFSWDPILFWVERIFRLGKGIFVVCCSSFSYVIPMIVDQLARFRYFRDGFVLGCNGRCYGFDCWAGIERLQWRLVHGSSWRPLVYNFRAWRLLVLPKNDSVLAQVPCFGHI